MLATTPTEIPPMTDTANTAPGSRTRRSVPLALIIFAMTALLLLPAFLPDISSSLLQTESSPAPVPAQPEALFVPGSAGMRPVINPPVMAADAPSVAPQPAVQSAANPIKVEETSAPVNEEQTEATYDAILHRRSDVPEKMKQPSPKPVVAAGAAADLKSPSAVKEAARVQVNVVQSAVSNSTIEKPSVADTKSSTASASQDLAMLKKQADSIPASVIMPRQIETKEKPPQSDPGFTDNAVSTDKRSEPGATQQVIVSIAPPETPVRHATQKYSGVVVIVNKANSNRITRSDISNIYQDRVTRWPSGDRIVVLDLPLDSGERDRFSSEMLNMSALDAATERSNRAITNRVRNEIRTRNAKAILSYVERNENAIGYVPAEMLNENEAIRVVFSIP